MGQEIIKSIGIIKKSFLRKEALSLRQKGREKCEEDI